MDCDNKTKSIWNIEDPYFSWHCLSLPVSSVMLYTCPITGRLIPFSFENVPNHLVAISCTSYTMQQTLWWKSWNRTGFSEQLPSLGVWWRNGHYAHSD